MRLANLEIQPRLSKYTNKNGIVHFEDMPVDDIILFLLNPYQYTYSEKLDGSSLVVGRDGGNLYTYFPKPTQKEHAFTQADYPIQFATTYRRAAHKALESIDKEILQKHLKNGDEIAVEVLYGDLPNIVQYDSPINHIFFLHKVKGTPDLESIQAATRNTRKTIHLDKIPYTDDGMHLKMKSENITFEFDIVQSYRVKSHQSNIIKQQSENIVKKLLQYLEQPSGISSFTNHQLYFMDLRSKPSNISANWKETSKKIKAYRDDELKPYIRNTIIKQIKPIMLDIFINHQHDKFFADGFVEGIVFTSIQYGYQFKLVNKDHFLKAKDFVWKIREIIRDTTFKSGIYDTSLLSIQGILGISPYDHKKVETVDDFLNNVSLSGNFEQTKAAVISKTKKAMNKMEYLLDRYLKKRSSMKANIGGTQFSYDNKDLNARTLQTFYESYKTISDLNYYFSRSTTMKDLYGAYFKVLK